MIYSLEGTISQVGDQHVVVVVGGCGFKVMMPRSVVARCAEGSGVKLFTHLHSSDAGLELYGFTQSDMLTLFEQLIGVSGVGPKLALAVLDAVDPNDLAGAVEGNRPDLISQAPGVGRKTAERIIVELRGKMGAAAPAETVRRLDADADLLDALVSLGYKREEARNALRMVGAETTDLQERLKRSLAILGKK